VKTYTLSLHEEFGGYEETEIDALSLEDAESKGREILKDWVREKEYEILGVIVNASYAVREKCERDWGEERYVEIRVPPDHEILIRGAVDVRTNSWLCGYSPDDHDWICDSSTSAEYRDHCRQCGLRRAITVYGSARKPGQHDTVTYHMPRLASLEPEEKDLDRISDRLHNSKNLPPGLL
jgi:hypothetical protein